METTKTLYIENPSAAIVAFIKKAQERKKERISKMREKLNEHFN
jgi:hypothetical protein